MLALALAATVPTVASQEGGRSVRCYSYWMRQWSLLLTAADRLLLLLLLLLLPLAVRFHKPFVLRRARPILFLRSACIVHYHILCDDRYNNKLVQTEPQPSLMIPQYCIFLTQSLDLGS